MGYDITAYLPKNRLATITSFCNEEHLPEEIACLSRGAHSKLAPELFQALHAERWDGKVSGNAGSQWFSRQEIIDAIQTLSLKLPEIPQLAKEIEFLATILKCMTRYGHEQYEHVFIWFC